MPARETIRPANGKPVVLERRVMGPRPTIEGSQVKAPLTLSDVAERLETMIGRGFFADVVAFDAEKIADHATYADPHRFHEEKDEICAELSALRIEARDAGRASSSRQCGTRR